jgi:hypothetical protein
VLRLGQAEQVGVAEAQGVGADRGVAGGQPHHRAGGGRLARARLAEHRHQLAAGDVEVDVDHRGHRAAAGAERDRQAAYV